MNEDYDLQTGTLRFKKERIEKLRALAANRKRHYFWSITLWGSG